MAHEIGDRVLLQADFSFAKAGSIGTVLLNYEHDDTLILRMGYDKDTGKVLVLGVARSSVRKIADKDLIDVDHKEIVSNNYWVGKEFEVGKHVKIDTVKSGDIGVVVDIKLKSNEAKDLIIFKFNDQEYTFDKEFVELNFNKYDKEVADMFGEEIVVKGMPKNFHLPGARVVFIDKGDNDEIVIIQSHDKELDLYNIETMTHEKLSVKKDELIPMMDAEGYLQNPQDQVVQYNYQTGGLLTALPNITKHALLNDIINPNDKIEIINVDYSNINAFEDVYLVVVEHRFNTPINLSYSDLQTYFVKYIDEEDEEEELDMNIFKKQQESSDDKEEIESVESQLENNEEYNDVPIQIHELSILGFRFKLDDMNTKFSIDNNKDQYEFNQIDDLIIALGQLSKLNKSNNN